MAHSYPWIDYDRGRRQWATGRGLEGRPYVLITENRKLKTENRLYCTLTYLPPLTSRM